MERQTIKQIDSVLNRNNNTSDYQIVNYDNLDTKLKEMKTYEKEIDIQLNRSKPYQSIRKYVKNKLGKRVYSLDQLFDKQASTIKNLNYSLTQTNYSARDELKSLERYVDRIHKEFQDSFFSRKDTKADVKVMVDKYIRLENKLQKTQTKTQNYFQTEKQLRQLKRGLSEGGLIYRELLDGITELESEKKYLNTFEDFFRSLIHSSERMVKKTERLERHIDNTKKAYTWCLRMGVGFKNVVEATEITSTNIQQLQKMLCDMKTDMTHKITDPDNTYNQFRETIESTRTATEHQINRNDSERDKTIDY